MRAKIVRVLLGAATLLLPGCSVFTTTTRNVIIEPMQFSDPLDRVGRHFRDRQLAGEAWDEILKRDGCDAYTKHYARGFVDGFVDYLANGGNCEPPPMPPRYYWRLYYQNPAGQAAIQDWFAGFRHGALVARASGYRNYVTIPTGYIPPESGVYGTNPYVGPAGETSARPTPTTSEPASRQRTMPGVDEKLDMPAKVKEPATTTPERPSQRPVVDPPAPRPKVEPGPTPGEPTKTTEPPIKLSPPPTKEPAPPPVKDPLPPPIKDPVPPPA